MTYQLKLDIFEGPLDLLLHLIKEQKMEIHDISCVGNFPAVFKVHGADE